LEAKEPPPVDDESSEELEDVVPVLLLLVLVPLGKATVCLPMAALMPALPPVPPREDREVVSQAALTPPGLIVTIMEALPLRLSAGLASLGLPPNKLPKLDCRARPAPSCSANAI